MSFPERLAKVRTEKRLGFPELARLTNIHATQLRRYEKGESEPTLEALRKLSMALNVPGDMLLFDEDERQPPEEFLLQFKALSQLSLEEKKTLKVVIDGLVLRHQAKELLNMQ